uniref:Uncharacterized protein n=1 Tax=Nelumbo nucifera TaxID=4432 RepID=A0A822YEG5_NELNU|nr:TPA_asm: hypothetical protein HUJ06_031359 [Nelumbo nucifera]
MPTLSLPVKASFPEATASSVEIQELRDEEMRGSDSSPPDTSGGAALSVEPQTSVGVQLLEPVPVSSSSSDVGVASDKVHESRDEEMPDITSSAIDDETSSLAINADPTILGAAIQRGS